MKKLIAVLLALALFVAGCSTDADVASYNIQKDADNFKVDRRIVFYNGVTGDYILTIEGKCSLVTKMLKANCPLHAK